MNWKTAISELNLFQQCKKYGIPLWQCPQFLFVVMGAVIGGSSIVFYLLGKKYVTDPYMITLLILAVTGTLLIIAFIITNSFERLAEANRMKSEFVSIVSHQLRSPLSNVKWAIEFLLSGRAGAIEQLQVGYFEILKENSARMLNLVNDLLQVSRLDQGTLSFEKKSFSFADMAQDVLREFAAVIKASNISVTVEGEQNLPLATSDPFRVRQVLVNLLDNAIRYSAKPASSVPRDGQERNSIRIRYFAQGKHLRVEIQDNGVGIREEDQPHIFQKFFRSSNALRHETQGSGLGLYIAKSIIERAGGEIGFQSEEHKGSTFWFTVPVA
ncbi:MAG: HAMP domain-containing histidine kinase [Candidatus Wildermuthbacteria bacterium]|nr:HAMP domain-containing histidine kinase [Candidatus Wildermuthbacteria bacterium]